MQNEVIGEMTVWMEARGEGLVGMSAVAWTLVNRASDPAKRYGRTLAEVCLRPLQYSCWNTNDPNRIAAARASDGDDALDQAGTVLEAALSGASKDPTGGATHYYSDGIPAPAWASPPARLTAKIGRLNFYAGVP